MLVAALPKPPPRGKKITCSDLASPAEWVCPLLLTSLKSIFKSQPPSPHSREPSASGSRPYCPASPGSPEQSHRIQSFSLSLRSHSSPALVSLDTRLAQSSYRSGHCSFSTMCTYPRKWVFPQSLPWVSFLLSTSRLQVTTKSPSLAHTSCPQSSLPIEFTSPEALTSPQIRDIQNDLSFFPNLFPPPTEPYIQVTQSPNLHFPFLVCSLAR